MQALFCIFFAAQQYVPKPGSDLRLHLKQAAGMSVCSIAFCELTINGDRMAAFRFSNVRGRFRNEFYRLVWCTLARTSCFGNASS